MGDDMTTIKIDDAPPPKGWICPRCWTAVNPIHATCPICSANAQHYVPIPAIPCVPVPWPPPTWPPHIPCGPWIYPWTGGNLW